MLRGAVETAIAAAYARLTPAVRRMAEGELFEAGLRVELAAYDDAGFYDRMQRARDRGLFHLARAVDNLVDLIGAALAFAAAFTGLAVLHAALLPVLVLGVLPSAWTVQRSARLAYAHMTRTVTLNRRVQMITELGTQREPAPEIRACQAQDFLLQGVRRGGRPPARPGGTRADRPGTRRLRRPGAHRAHGRASRSPCSACCSRRAGSPWRWPAGR